jgi:RNA polymerase sigma-70 factor (ECF subfamily)
MVNDTDLASDIVQEVFIYLHEKLQKGHQINHLRSWLSKAVYNRCIDFLRKPKRNVGLDVVEKQGEEDRFLEKEETKKVIRDALEKLKINEKLLAVLYSEGFSYKEMAEISGIKMSSIGNTLSRTLKKLKKELTAQGYELHE